MSDRNESLGRAAKGDSSLRSAKSSRVVSLGRVVSIDDPKGAMRIKVRVKGVDDKFSDEELPYSSPFLPKFLNIVPKLGESVKVIFYDANNPYTYREWVGPIISQPQNLPEDKFFFTARAGMDSSAVALGKSIKNIVTAEGVYPSEEDIALQGRDNADITFKKSEVMIRAAKFEPNKPTIKNNRNPMSIHMRWLDPNELGLKEDRTDINLMGNKLFLIGRDSNSRIINPEISLEEQVTLQNKLHPLVYGDVLYDFMITLREWIFSHTHPYANMPTNAAEDANIKIRKWYTEKLPLLCSLNIFAGGDIEALPISKSPNPFSPDSVNSSRLQGNTIKPWEVSSLIFNT